MNASLFYVNVLMVDNCDWVVTECEVRILYVNPSMVNGWFGCLTIWTSTERVIFVICKRSSEIEENNMWDQRSEIGAEILSTKLIMESTR